MRVQSSRFRVVLLTRRERHPHAHRRVWRRRRRSLWKSWNSSRTPIASTIWAGKCLKASSCTPQPLHAHTHTLPPFLFICFSSSSSVSLALLHHMLHLPHHIISLSYPPSLTTTAACSYGPPGTGKTLLARAVAGEAACVTCHVSRVTCDVWHMTCFL